MTDRRRRYCSAECRQGLQSKLDLSVGLLRTLQARFATFSFTESELYLHVLPVNSDRVFSYVCDRNSHNTPAQDLWTLIDRLGRVWHTKKRATGKRYVATQHVLDQAGRNQLKPDSLRPVEEKKPAVPKRSLGYFKLTSRDLVAPNARNALKAAYRREAKIHHPDHGGDAAAFRKIHEAHQDLIRWIKNPRFTTRRGVPEKWSYDSCRGRKWLPPAIRTLSRK